MTAISELTGPASALTGMERLPGLKGADPIGLPLFALAGLPSGDVLALMRPFLADTAATADADPGAGNVRWNHATQASATMIFISDADTDAADLAAALATLSTGGYLYLQGVGIAGAPVWQKWQVSTITDAVGYTKLGVSLQASQGSFADNAQILLSVQQPDEAGGGSAAASVAVQYTAETGSTADSDPGAGLLKWNNATQGSATVLYLDDATVDAVSMAAFWPALDAGGFAYLQHATDQDTWQIWEITAVTVATGYVKLGATLLANGGSFADGDAMLVTLEQGAAAGGGGGLANWTDAISTSAPNATIPVASLTAANAATNVDAAIRPKGTGAILGSVPDNATTGGNKRGDSAVDLQTSRTSAAQVASGSKAVIAGGYRNTASGTESVVGGGDSNTASQTNAVVCGGSNNTASNVNAMVLGGDFNTASGQAASVYGGTNNSANGSYSTAAGLQANTRSVIGMDSVAYGSGRQRDRLLLKATTSDATAKVLSVDAAAASASNQFTIPSGRAYVFKGMVVARNTSTGDTKAWTFEGAIKNIGGATSLVAAVSPAVVAADAGASSWGLTVTADNTVDCIKVEATGAAGTTIEWECHIEGVGT